MKITCDVLVSKRIEFEVPAHLMPYMRAWLVDDDERTDEQWDLLEGNSWNKILQEFLPENEKVSEVEIYSVLEE